MLQRIENNVSTNIAINTTTWKLVMCDNTVENNNKVVISIRYYVI